MRNTTWIMLSIILIAIVVVESFDLNSPWIPTRGTSCLDVAQ